MHCILRVRSVPPSVIASTLNGLAALVNSPKAYTLPGSTAIISLMVTLRPITFSTVNVVTASVALLRISSWYCLPGNVDTSLSRVMVLPVTATTRPPSPHSGTSCCIRIISPIVHAIASVKASIDTVRTSYLLHRR